MKITIIGGGASGIFTAINIAEKHPDYVVTVLEKSSKLLSKVKVSGGGRCNVTNERSEAGELVKFYPRGHKKLYKVFKTFSTLDMVNWLGERGVATKAEPDHRVFPISDDSQTIIDCFLAQARKHKVEIRTGVSMIKIEQRGNQWLIETNDGEIQSDKVIIATGASPSAWQWLGQLGLKLVSPVPSLFTFDIKDERLQELQGISFEHVQVKVVGTKLVSDGPLLMTHWGLSGPAILKLSAWGARELHQKDYRFDILVNYLHGLSEADVRSQWQTYKTAHAARLVINYPLWGLPRRFWEKMIEYSGINAKETFGEVSKKSANKLTEELIQGKYSVTGKSTFKDEFVTAGGVDLSEIDFETFECKRFPGLLLAGEVLDIDAVTGGFNFQACWSAGWIISETI